MFLDELFISCANCQGFKQFGNRMSPVCPAFPKGIPDDYACVENIYDSNHQKDNVNAPKHCPHGCKYVLDQEYVKRLKRLEDAAKRGELVPE